MTTNVQTRIEGTKLIIEVDLTENHGQSSTGKSTIIGSTHGFLQVGDVSVSLNVVKPNKARRADALLRSL